MNSERSFDVIIIGGSYAGLSAGLALARSMRNILIIDSGNPCNKSTPHSHNFLTQDGKTPQQIAEIAKKEVLQYDTVTFYNGLAVTGKKLKPGFSITTDAGDTFIGKKLIFATGITDTIPNIKGFSECWGITAVHCPYCHGYELRNKKTAILANGERAFHLASLVSNLTKDLTIFTAGEPDFHADQMERIQHHNIPVYTNSVVELVHENGMISEMVLDNGDRLPFDALYAAFSFTQQSTIPAELGCSFTEQGHIKIDHFQQTTVHGIYACGDNTNMMRSLANAVYTGNLTGALVNKSLTEDSF